MIFEEIAELLVNGGRVDVAHHDEGDIVRHVTRLIILQHLVARELIENIHLTNDRQPIRVPLKRRHEK